MEIRPQKLNFARPPIEEIVLSVLFQPLDGFLAPHLGEIWRELKKEGFVNIAEQPPVISTMENFSKIGGEPELHIGNVPNLARIWFIHKDDNQIIQVQRDRFTFNWRKTEAEQNYPGFSAILEKFAGFYNRFGETIQNMEVGALTPLQYELTYIDQLMRGEGWNNFEDMGKIYNLFMDAQPSDSFWSGAESMVLRASFPIEDLHSRLYLTIGNRVRVSDQRQTLQTDFTMRGFPLNAERAMRAWFKWAHDRICEKFVRMFTEGIQTQIWERKT